MLTHEILMNRICRLWSWAPERINKSDVLLVAKDIGHAGLIKVLHDRFDIDKQRYTLELEVCYIVDDTQTLRPTTVNELHVLSRKRITLCVTLVKTKFVCKWGGVLEKAKTFQWKTLKMKKCLIVKKLSYNQPRHTLIIIMLICN